MNATDECGGGAGGERGVAGECELRGESSYLQKFLKSVPDVSAKLKDANTEEIKFEQVVEQAKQAAVLVLVC